MTKKFYTPITLPADPATTMEAATKRYVDTKQAKLPDGDDAGQVLATVDGTGTNVMWVNPPPFNSGWNTLQLLSPWTAYGENWGPPQYRQLGDEIQLRGLVRSTGGMTNIALLPSSFRPQLTPRMLLGWVAWNNGGARCAIRIDIRTDGIVALDMTYFPSGYVGPTGNIDYLSLDNLRFARV
jgi:hypothetical protein